MAKFKRSTKSNSVSDGLDRFNQYPDPLAFAESSGRLKAPVFSVYEGLKKLEGVHILEDFVTSFDHAERD